MQRKHSCRKPSRPGESNKVFYTNGPAPPAGFKLPVVSGRLGASRQQTTEGARDAASLGLMVIGSISMHFHTGLCHKFTCFQTGLLTAGNAVGDGNWVGGGVGVPPGSRPEHLRTPPAPSPQSHLSLLSLSQAALLLSDSPWQGGLSICSWEQPGEQRN